ncbi:hypothetical protein [Oricola sp.]|uniref:hypothetical protein n=1 Tax=Oricola sp. TaxID=1979950 RepID=UPI0025F5EC89|nr:hypothetical protein [Oricola sp.]MCI5075571.1 hypothetical protein [Oricola sp.]
MTTRKPQIRVSDHAIVRWLQRECGWDIEALRTTIGECCERGAAAGAPVVIVGSVKFVIEDNVVVTTLDKTMRPRKPRAR